MKKIAYTSIFLIFYLPYIASAQASNPFNRIKDEKNYLEIGDTIPDFLLAGVHNYSSDTLKFSDLRGKLVVLDFWGIYCGACIAGFPELDSLQKAFSGKIQIILVTTYSQNDIKKMFSRLKRKVNLPDVPSVTSDTLLYNHFFYRTIPHHVWIDQQGVVREITMGQNTNFETIGAFLKGEDLDLYEKKDAPYFDIQINDNGSDNRLIYYSSLMKKVRELPYYDNNWIIDKSSGKKIGVRFLGSSIVDLFEAAFAEDPSKGDRYKGTYIYDNRVILEMPDPEKYIAPRDVNQWYHWMDKYAYRYTLRIPVSKSDQLFDIMKRQLKLFFGITGDWEYRKVKCLTLIRTTKKDFLRSKGGVTSYGVDGLKLPLLLRNAPLSIFVNSLRFYNRDLATPIIDDTNYEGMVDIAISAVRNDISAIRKELLPYGLDLIYQEKEIKMLVLKGDK